MESNEQIKLRFKGVDFPFIQLNSIQSYVGKEESQVNIEILPRFFFPQGQQNAFNIIMQVELSVDDFFKLNITGVGSFELSKDDVTDEEKKSFINANSTAMMFPYVRAFISTLTSNLGNVTTPIILSTRFFKGELEEFKELPQPELFDKSK